MRTRDLSEASQLLQHDQIQKYPKSPMKRTSVQIDSIELRGLMVDGGKYCCYVGRLMGKIAEFNGLGI